MAEESDKEQLQQSGNNRTAHALYASRSIYAATKVGVATKIQNIGPDQPDRLLRPCFNYISVVVSSRIGRFSQNGSHIGMHDLN